MKLGLNTAILGHLNFEEALQTAQKIGYECLEVACWPQGKAERRYAGVSHIDVDNLDVNYIHELLKKYEIEISALAYYPNTMDPDLQARQVAIEHLKKVIDAAHALDVNMVGTFVGRDPKKTVSENFELFKEIWPPIIQYAQEKGVKVAIENCPMWFTDDEWPGGKNLMTTPANWRRAFEIIDSDYFGINYDPSHFVWQMIDYIKPIYEFKDKIFHVHFKDMKVYRDRLNEVGTMANPLEYIEPKIPGLGDVDWAQYVSALNDVGYKGYACVEVEDRTFEENEERIFASCALSYRYLRQFIQ
jgi:sugar phosphate isomerase/epimerase